MMRNLVGLICVAILTIALCFAGGSEALAAVDPDQGLQPEVCISAAVETQVRTCPKGAGVNKFRDVARAKVGVSTKVKDKVSKSGE